MLLSMLIIAAIFSFIVSAQITTLSRTYEFPENQLIINYPWHDNTKLLYARCNSSQLMLGKKCVVSVMIDAFENLTIVASECEVTLKSSISDAIVSDSLFVFKFGSDKVIVVWMVLLSDGGIGRSILKTSVVNMKDRCQTLETETVHEYVGRFDAEVMYQTYVNVISSKDTYELVVKNKINVDNNTDPNELGWSILKFDKQAQLLSSNSWPVPIYQENRDVYNVVAVKPGHSENGYFVFNCNREKSIALIMMRQEDAREYEKLVLKETQDSKFDFYIGISLTNRAVGICYYFASDSQIECCQFNQQGQLQLSAKLNFSLQHRNSLPTICNLRNGGFLIVVVIDSDVDQNPDYNLFKIMKEDMTHEVVKFQFDTKCDQPNDRIVLRAFGNKKNEYCVVRLCERKVGNSTRLDTIVRCFSSDDFSKYDDGSIKQSIPERSTNSSLT